eukprot:CAMPEP_0206250854 /NCGR_PEP_ID=MMETSP0047_2-20121206/21703_1 /ASSEMBLY_ACC=CAM_ASM_000192 /TAXON_ID=195065 /ORGANISM="Chroomonas mesostigmatica_cf, Strain CCMP1168" /LENGTH=319 /DNA_ID=CAMNT_0053676749 /DNA_START=25 /DNA_END=985 /DNA_ORIENTATION=-
MAIIPSGPPQHQTQFFGALLVASVILVGSAVVLTERPVWMNGAEPSFGVLRPFSEPAPPPKVYTPKQLKAMATRGRAAGEEVDDGDAGLTAQSGEAVVHKDDRYIGVEQAPGPDYPPTHGGQDLDVLQFGEYPVDTGSHTSKRLQKQDTIVPTRDVQMSTYPLMGLQDAQGISDHKDWHNKAAREPYTANIMFARALQRNGLGDGRHIETVSGGLGANSEPPLDRIYDMIEGEHGHVRIDHGQASYVALWIMAVLVFLGAVIILGYNLLPEGSFSKAWANWNGVDYEKGTWARAYYEPPSQAMGGVQPLMRGAAMQDVV